jgi:hypothetical protein
VAIELFLFISVQCIIKQRVFKDLFFFVKSNEWEMKYRDGGGGGKKTDNRVIIFILFEMSIESTMY